MATLAPSDASRVAVGMVAYDSDRQRLVELGSHGEVREFDGTVSTSSSLITVSQPVTCTWFIGTSPVSPVLRSTKNSSTGHRDTTEETCRGRH